MSPLWILLIAMVLVVGGVLVLRLHAFLALILGALVVALLTPGATVYEHELWREAVRVVDTVPSGERATLAAGSGHGVVEGTTFHVLRPEGPGGRPRQVGRLVAVEVSESRSVVRLEAPAGPFALESTDLVLHPVHERSARATSEQTIGERIAAGFGRTALGIGILIAMAAIIGRCLLESGAAERVVLAARRAVGERRTPVAFVGSGFVLGIPVFFDTVFYLLLPLGKALAARTGRHYLLYVLTIVAGATMAHSLVPPTPGPLFVASELEVDLGLMMIAGVFVGLFTATTGYAYAVWADRRWTIPLRPSAELTAEELEAMASRDERLLPPISFALLPILLPVVLIASRTAVEMLYGEAADPPAWLTAVRPALDVAGNRNVALILGAAVALLLLAIWKRTSRRELAGSVQNALASGGVVILITCAGGAFGHVLQQTGIAAHLERSTDAAGHALLLLPIAFAVTAVVRIAQGSATVAMITAVGVVAPLAVAGELGFNPLYLALAIGCGSKPIPWMNDSGFWIISRMTGMTEAETLKTASVMMSLMGVAGLLIVVPAAMLFPLV